MSAVIGRAVTPLSNWPGMASADTTTSMPSAGDSSVQQDNGQDYPSNYSDYYYYGDEGGAGGTKEFQVDHYIWIVGGAILLLVGTFGNILALAVLSRPRMRNSNVSVYLMVVAGADLVVLYTGLLRNVILTATGTDLREHSAAVCKVHTTVVYVALDLSSWLLAALSVERCVSVRWPHRVRRHCTRRTSLCVIIVLAVLLLAVNGHFFFLIGDVTVLQGNQSFEFRCVALSEEAYHFVAIVWPWIDLSIFALLPLIVHVVCNTIIVRSVLRSLRGARRTRGSCAGQQLEGGRAAIRQVSRGRTSSADTRTAELLSTRPIHSVSSGALDDTSANTPAPCVQSDGTDDVNERKGYDAVQLGSQGCDVSDSIDVSDDDVKCSGESPEKRGPRCSASTDKNGNIQAAADGDLDSLRDSDSVYHVHHESAPGVSGIPIPSPVTNGGPTDSQEAVCSPPSERDGQEESGETVTSLNSSERAVESAGASRHVPRVQVTLSSDTQRDVNALQDSRRCTDIAEETLAAEESRNDPDTSTTKEHHSSSTRTHSPHPLQHASLRRTSRQDLNTNQTPGPGPSPQTSRKQESESRPSLVAHSRGDSKPCPKVTESEPRSSFWTRKRQRSTWGSVEPGSRGPAQQSEEDRVSSMTWMLVTVSIVFCVTTLPVSLYTLINWILVDQGYISPLRQVTWAVLNILMYTNNAINFLLYSLSGSRFRAEMRAMWHRCCPRRRPPRRHQPHQRHLPCSTTISSSSSYSMTSLATVSSGQSVLGRRWSDSTDMTYSSPG